MARTIDAKTAYRVRLHKNNGYNYASTQPIVVDSQRKSGRNKHIRIHWGTVDENKVFHPNQTYMMASPSERGKLIFPDDWDLSEVQKLPSAKKAAPSIMEEDTNLLYGDLWLLEKAADATGVREDLIAALDGNKEKADAILTIAMYQVSNGGSFNRIYHWQQIERTPCSKPLTAPFITTLTQSITESNRMKMLKLRAARINDGDLCAVDSTSRSAYGKSLADIKWGYNKEHLPLEQTNEVVVYDLNAHMPIYYRTFPGNIPDSRSIETILLDLKHAGFPKIILITDKGYESLQNLERYILDGQPLIMWVRIKQRMIMNRIREFGNFSHAPEKMSIDADSRLYYRQYDLDYTIDIRKNCQKKADRLKLNLYFNPIVRSEMLLQLDIDIERQRNALREISASALPIDDEVSARRNYKYFKLEIEKGRRKLLSFTLDEKKVNEAKLTAGFYANVTHAVDYAPMKAAESYALRDEQEKYFEQMKGPLGTDRQRCWSEDGKNGRLFIYFVALILASYVKHVWKSSILHKLFDSFSEILDEMRSIRWIEHKGYAKNITPFVGKQIDICKVFGFDIPEECQPKYRSKKTPVKKRGRPAKPAVETLPMD